MCVEIGPGPGGLTAALLKRCERLVAVELDGALASALRERFASVPQLEVVEGDVLETDLAQWGEVVVCGNLPYYITSPIVEKTLSLGPLLKRAVFLVQKEVAERIAAAPGSRDYGYLSVATQLHCHVERLFLVKPASFRPPPKVDSAVVRLTPHSVGMPVETRDFLAFASACFRQKRKTLKNNLSGLFAKEVLDAHPRSGARAEQLSVAELIALQRELKAGG